MTSSAGSFPYVLTKYERFVTRPIRPCAIVIGSVSPVSVNTIRPTDGNQ
jgi:hypothetical protein